MNSSIDVRNKNFDPGLIALLMFNKNNRLEKPLKFPIHLKIPKPLVKMIFDYAVGKQIEITVRLYSKNYSLIVSPTTKLSEIASIFNENHKIQTRKFIEDSVFDIFFDLQNEIKVENDMLQMLLDPKDIQYTQLRINDYQVRLNKLDLMPDHKTLRDCAIQDGHKLVLISED